MFVRRYLIPRLLQYFLVIFLGITIVFFIPRFAPTNPVQRTIAELRSRGTYLNPADVEKIVRRFDPPLWTGRLLVRTVYQFMEKIIFQ